MRGISARRAAAALLLAPALAACVPQVAAGPAPVSAAAAATSYPVAGLEAVMGRTAAALAAQFGAPDFDQREGNARKLQFLGPACVLDAYLYPPRGGGEPVVTHVDARLPDGRDMDRASCVAAMGHRRR